MDRCDNKCPLCDSTASVQKLRKNYPNIDKPVFGIECSVCGSYHFIGDYPDLKKLGGSYVKFCAENLKLNRAGLTPVWGEKSPSIEKKNYVFRDFNEYKSLPILHSEKPSKILQKLSEKADTPFQMLSLSNEDYLICEVDIKNTDESRRWHRYLYKEGYIENEQSNEPSTAKGWAYLISAKGWEHIEKTNLTKNNRVFVAQKFEFDHDPQRRKNILSAIQEACRKLGYEALPVDGEEHNQKICDKIVVDIRKSQFVIADLSGNNSGVYFEAGYAMGLDKQVILTIAKEDSQNPHFDINHYPIIFWENYGDLTRQLTHRIERLFGKHSF